MRRSTQFLLSGISTLIILCAYACQRTESTTHELLKGFKATPSPSVSSFHALLSDATNNFSLGFLRVNSKELALTVLHVRSLEPVWVANPSQNQLAPWSDRTQLLFNGSLVISGPHGKVYWSTGTETQGDRVVLLNTSNLQLQKLESHDDSPSVLWQSFDFPSNTLIENQNFGTNMSLVSSNGLYSMRLGNNFMGLYAKFKQDSEQIYWRHKAMEAKAQVIQGQGPIYARVNSDGFLGMYQAGTNPPVDMQPFNSFQRNITGLRLVRLELDGNLKAYYWDGFGWALDFQAISEICELPSPCGSYGLCRAGWSGCSCLDNRTQHSPGECFALSGENKGDLCSSEGGDGYWILRRNGVDLPFKELMRYETAPSLEQCEDLCAKNCSCWGAVHHNATGFCSILDYPIETLLGVGAEDRMGFFKVPQGARKKKMGVGFGVGIGILCGTILICMMLISFGSNKFRIRRRGVKRILEEEDGISPGPYKDLASASFRSIEMCNNNQR